VNGSVGLELSRVLGVGLLAAARLAPVFLLAPFFGGRLLPAPLRVGLSLAFVALLWPVLHLGTPDLSALGPVTLAALVAKEVSLGTILAFLASTPFWAAEAAGRLADSARGANLAEVLVPQSGDQTSPLGDLGLQLSVVLFFVTGGHLLFLRSLAESYQAVPLFGFPESGALAGAAELAAQASGRLLLAALGMAAPVLAALFLADLALGLMSRAAPQIQAYFVGLPLKALIGVFIFLLALTATLGATRGHFAEALRAVEAAIERWR
jgi:type III secretion protein SpaR/YscT/HrcT